MLNCSKCNIVVVSGDYIEVDDKPVCLACALKQNKISKKHINGWMERFTKHTPFWLQIITILTFISGLFSIAILRNSTPIIGIVGIVFAIAFFALGFGLVFLLNKARIALITVTAISILFDLYALSNQLSSSTTGIIRIIISVCIIAYLVTPKVKKMFV